MCDIIDLSAVAVYDSCINANAPQMHHNGNKPVVGLEL